VTLPIDRVDLHGRPVPIAPGGPQAALAAGQAVHAELRTALPEDYAGYMARMFDEGARMTQLIDDRGQVRGIAVWRTFHTTYCGYRLEIDDLVTAAADRSRGYGAVLLGAVEAHARALGVDTVTLNSGTHRTAAHRFYHRARYTVSSFHFSKTL
jgi:GNAT superfamily N-acetyltransferase